MLPLSRISRSLLMISLLAAALPCLLNTHLNARLARADHPVMVGGEEVIYVPSKTQLRVLMAGYDQAAADVMWLRTLAYFGQHFETDRRYTWLEHFVHVIVGLDPRFRKVYHWAAVSVVYGRLFTRENIERSSHFYELALAQFPDDQEAAFGLGFNFYYELRDPDLEQRAADRQRGLEYLEMAANMPGAPETLKGLVASLYSKNGREALARWYWTDIYLRTTDEHQREALKARLTREGVDLSELEAAHEAFEAKRKAHFPYLDPLFFGLLEDRMTPALEHQRWPALLPHISLSDPPEATLGQGELP